MQTTGFACVTCLDSITKKNLEQTKLIDQIVGLAHCTIDCKIKAGFLVKPEKQVYFRFSGSDLLGDIYRP